MSQDVSSRAFEVVRYLSFEDFKAFFADKEKNYPQCANGRLHTSEYFEAYFQKINVKTIVRENEYIDRDYLEDFTAYYIRCFEFYGGKCFRLHFFGEEFRQEDLENRLRGMQGTLNWKNLDDSYLGFIVVKPLPQTYIGRTCLKIRDPNGERRHFPISRWYNANLFGISLAVESLAFQEQDNVVSACATSALWSALHWTGKEFQHPIPSPVEITRLASAGLPLETRSLPNNGLTGAQMSHAIRSVGLDPILLRFQDPDNYRLRIALYAYLKGKLPIVLGVNLEVVEEIENINLHSNKSELCYRIIEKKGKHAVAVVGYSLGKGLETYKENQLLLTASRMDKLYVHDDQVGPFSAMTFTQLKIQEGNRVLKCPRLKTGFGPNTLAEADLIILPAYHKIRIPFDTVYTLVLRFNEFLEAFRKTGNLPFLNESLEWDIYLRTVNDFKGELLLNSDIEAEIRSKILMQPMPKFIWYANATHERKSCIDLLFDATDIEQGNLFIRAVEYNQDLSKFLRGFAQGLPEAWYQSQSLGLAKVIKWFRISE